MGLEGLVGEVPAEAEVGELEAGVGEEDVARLDVAVHDAAVVHVADGGGHLLEVLPHVRLLEGAAGGEALADEALEVAAAGPLEDDDEGVVLDEGVEHRDDVRVGEGAEELHLLQAPLALLLGELEDLDLLHGDDGAVSLRGRSERSSW